MKDGFPVFFVITDVSDQEGNAGKFSVVLTIGGKVLSRAHEGNQLLWDQGLKCNRVSLGGGVGGACCQNGIGVQAFDDGRERMVITGCHEGLFIWLYD